MKTKTPKPISIFLVEDHHIMRRGLASLLKIEEKARIVGEAASGEEALALLFSSPFPDLIIMDISLSGMDGIQATREIIAKKPQAKILILSMYNNPTFLHKALEAGISGYILKESLVDELHTAIQAIMNGGRYMSEKISQTQDEEMPLLSLTPREMEVFEKLAIGVSVKEIALENVISIYTVYAHISNIKRKLGIEKNFDIIRYAMENKIILREKKK
jgi:DNA-binding NarL/FixJ family response regulator